MDNASVSTYLLDLQRRIVAALQALDGQPFRRDSWERKEGGGGTSCLLENGNVFERAGVKPGQQIVTYCAVGMRASLMAWAATSLGLPAQVYVGSWQDWSQDAANPVVK